MKAKLTLIPKISIHPNRINFYNEVHWDPARPYREKDCTESKLQFNSKGEIVEVQKNKHDHLLKSTRSAEGKVSKTARKKMDTALDYMLLLSNEKQVSSNYSGRCFKFKIAFVTLDLPSEQIHSDNEIKDKCLNQFLIEIKKRYKVKNYLWRAEKQKNGNIHFHLIVDKFIPWSELRDRWNRIINKLGYVDRYREKLKAWHKDGFRVRTDLLKTWPKEKQYNAWLKGKKTDYHSPNSTDIHSIKNIYNIKKYVTKYLTKPPEKITTTDPILKKKLEQKGRIWGCNYEMSNIKGAQILMDSVIQGEMQKIKDTKKFWTFSDTYFSITYIDFDMLETIDCDALFRAFCGYMFVKFGWSYQMKIKK